jgi:DNA-binding transcriptional LysR family regulator
VDIHQIRGFLAVADELHFGRAAERLHITASPLSRRIRDLEQELGRDLFVREYHNVELTEFGRKFTEPARDVLRRFDALRDIEPGADGPRCRVGATPLAPPQVLDAVLATFAEHAPDVELPVTLKPSSGLLEELTRASIDLAVVHLPLGTDAFDSLEMAASSCAIAMRADDRLANRNALTCADLVDRQVFTTSSKVHPPVMRAMRDRLLASGVTHLVELPHNDIVQLATHLLRTGGLALTSADHSLLSSRILSSPDFTVVALDEPGISLSAGIAWRPEAVAELPELAPVIAALRERYGTARGPTVHSGSAKLALNERDA